MLGFVHHLSSLFAYHLFRVAAETGPIIDGLGEPNPLVTFTSL